MSGMRSRRKGNAGERELARVLTEAGFPAHRGQQYQGGAESQDVACPALPGIHIEVKRSERFSLYEAMAQVQAEAGGKVPIVVNRRNRGEWLAILDLRHFLEILGEAVA